MSDTFKIELTVPQSVTRKIAGELFTIALNKAPVASLEWALIRGLRAVNDAANSAKKVVTDADGSWRRGDSEAFVAAFMDGTIAEKAARGEGASVLDPVTVEARKLATSHILGKLASDTGAESLTWKEAAATAKGARFFKISDKGNVSQDGKEIDSYITAYDAAAKEGRGFKARAAIIVATRADDDEEVHIHL